MRDTKIPNHFGIFTSSQEGPLYGSIACISFSHTTMDVPEDDLDALLDDAVDSAWGEGSGEARGGGGSDDDMYDDDDLDALLDDALDDSEFEKAATEAAAAARAPPPPMPPHQHVTPAAKRTAAPSSDPVSRILEDAGLPPAIAAKWARNISADKALQTRAGAQRPFSHAYSAWSEKDVGTEEVGDGTAAAHPRETRGDDDGDGAGAALADDSGARMGNRMFGESLQFAVRKGHFQSASVSKSVSAALHGRGADTELVAKLQETYLGQVLRDTIPRLKTDPDRMAATREGRFPHIQALLRE